MELNWKGEKVAKMRDVLGGMRENRKSERKLKCQKNRSENEDVLCFPGDFVLVFNF